MLLHFHWFLNSFALKLFIINVHTLLFLRLFNQTSQLRPDFYLLNDGLMFWSMHMFAPLTQRGVCWFWSRAFVSHQCFISQSLIQRFVCPSTEISSQFLCWSSVIMHQAGI